MKHRHNRVFILNKPTRTDAFPSKIGTLLASLMERLSGATVDSPSRASSLLYLGEEPIWITTGHRSAPNQPVLIWFEAFLDEEIYRSAIDDFPNARFLHGLDGLQELTCSLEAQGVIEAGAQEDPLADDAFLKLRGEYISKLETLLAASEQDHEVPVEVQGKRLQQMVAGAAGTYEFFSVAAASEAYGEPTAGASFDAAKWISAISRAVETDREIYNQQIEACLPAAVELSVRQRVLVISDDPAIVNQLQFALSHSRMETTFVGDPVDLVDILNTTQPDILVIEQSLTHFDGMDIAAYVRTLERFQAMPILALLRDETERTVTRAIRAGVDNRLTLPFSAANLALSVLNLLSRVEISRKLGGRDNLTGLYTKAALVDRLEQDLLRVARSGKQIAVMLVHLRGSLTPRVDFLALVEVAKRVFRRSDILARFNEATLAVVLPGIDARTVLSISNRFHQVLDGRLAVETAVSISEGTVDAAALMADVEIRLTRALHGSREGALGIYEDASRKEKRCAAPRLLIADTDEAIIKLLSFFCIREGFEVSDVRNGTDLLNRLQRGRDEESLPDLIVMESFLPGVDGFQVLERIQGELAGRISVIMMSVRPGEERIATAFKLGAIDFVAKPFRVPEMIARIRNGLGRSYAM